MKRHRTPKAHDLKPHRSPTALLILDMLSDYRFPDGKSVLRAARRIAPAVQHLKVRAKRAGLAVCYVNDNPGRWRSDLSALLAHVMDDRSPGREIAQALAPEATDYVVLKPRHSAFYATPLAELLEHWQTRRLILVGVSSHQCVLFTANDAHLRRFELSIPRVCIGAAKAADTRFALRYFEDVLDADTRSSRRMRL